MGKKYCTFDKNGNFAGTVDIETELQQSYEKRISADYPGMKSFHTIRSVTANYTPSDLIHEYAKAVKANDYYDRYFRHIVTLATADGWKDFQYHHWKIVPNGDGTETVTVFLEEV